MKPLIFIGGPLIACLWFCFHSDLITYGNQHPGMVHVAGVNLGGTFSLLQTDTYVCEGENCTLVDSKTEFSEVEGLDFEEETIEYRDGVGSSYNKTKQPGLPKYADIRMQRPTGFDWKGWRFIFERQAAIEAVEKEYDEKWKEMQAEE